MGQYIGLSNYNEKEKEKENYSDICALNEKNIQMIYEKINALKEKDKSSMVIDDLIINYEKLFKYKNTNEEDFLNYLLLYNEKLNKKEISHKELQEKLDIYGIFISDSNFEKNFSGFSRVNSLTKINKLIEILKSDLNDDIDFEKRKAFIKQLYDLEKEPMYNSKFHQDITWENKELYLFFIYRNFLMSLLEKADIYKRTVSIMALKNEFVMNKKVELYNLKTKELAEEFCILNLCEGEFIKIYINYLQEFLIDVNDCYNIRFGKNKNWIDNEENRTIFEDYFQFLCSYNFNGSDNVFITNFWTETFCSTSYDEKKQLIEDYFNIYNKKKKNRKSFELNENELIIKRNNKVVNKIKDIDIYVFSNLIRDINDDSNSNHLDFYLNKNLKPNYYNTHLFMMKNKDLWKQLTIDILNSKALIEVQECLFNCPFIDILSDRTFLSNIFDNIKYFIYTTNFSANTNLLTKRIYEYGLYPKHDNKNISLLIYYAFNNISNIHEIGGHININMQKKCNTIFESPKIDKFNSNSCSFYAQKRGKESEETIDIQLFGRKIDSLTIKEALFSLDPINYTKGKEYFKENFIKCNNLDFKEIVNHSSKEKYFNNLGIDIEQIPEDIYSSFPLENKSRINIETEFKRDRLDHPIEFYYNLSK